jgi:CRISPR-associated endonuclease/helicase Cas3
MAEAGEVSAWAKRKEDGNWLSVAQHGADVAAVFLVLMEQPGFRRRMAALAGLSDLDDRIVARLAALAWLHDVGKLNAGFQFKTDAVPPPGLYRAGHVTEARQMAEGRNRTRHILDLDALFPGPPPGPHPLLLAALAHHGRPADEGSSRMSRLWQPVAGYDPLHQASLLVARLRADLPLAFDGGALPDGLARPAFQHAFAGLVALADQIGSNEAHFPVDPARNGEGLGGALEHARKAVSRIGLAVEERRGATAPFDFAAGFGFTPNPMQQAVLEASLDAPLMILESETGSGKTEAAFARFAMLFQAGLVDGLYFALPTRAAAIQLHARITRACKAFLPAGNGYDPVLAVPGYLQAGESRGRREARFQVFWDEGGAEDPARFWAAEDARRFLSAPVAVGTVDQAMLAALAVKHAPMRAAGLMRNLLVIDEVHASDPYMTEVIAALLEAHLAAGGHALLMSATLGAAARCKWLSGRRAEPPPQAEAAASCYPALWLRRADTAECRCLPAEGRRKHVALEARPWLGNEGAVAAEALAAAKRGGKILVIRNTVDSAVAVTEAIEAEGGAEFLLNVEGRPTLHHGRFAREDRILLDQAVEAALGRGRNAGGQIIVGSQTLEQSLDIDADFLISDLCPVDVLLQRLGRLHRHPGTIREEGFEVPHCLMLCPEAPLKPPGLPRHGLGLSQSGGIYPDLRVLEQTRRLVTTHLAWTIPEMNRFLVEAATHPDSLAELEAELGQDWASHGAEVAGKAVAESSHARLLLFPRDAGYEENPRYGSMDESGIRTRIGAQGPEIDLPEGTAGAFGQTVTRLVLPAYLAKGLGEDDEVKVTTETHGFRLEIGGKSFQYGRWGLRSER